MRDRKEIEERVEQIRALSGSSARTVADRLGLSQNYVGVLARTNGIRLADMRTKGRRRVAERSLEKGREKRPPFFPLPHGMHLVVLPEKEPLKRGLDVQAQGLPRVLTGLTEWTSETGLVVRRKDKDGPSQTAAARAQRAHRLRKKEEASEMKKKMRAVGVPEEKVSYVLSKAPRKKPSLPLTVEPSVELFMAPKRFRHRKRRKE